MTRMWGVSPTCLCDQHLLGEHKEMHQEAGTITNHPHGHAIARGHAENGQVDTSQIQQRHDELARELERRGMNHNSPLDYDDTLDIGTIDIDANRRDLNNRCQECDA